MLAAVFKENNSESYIYLDSINNKLSYSGVTLFNNNIRLLDKDLIIHIYDIFKLNDNCDYIEDYKNYKVYYDRENGLKHFVSDGLEDFLMFLIKNGKSVVLNKKRLFPYRSNNKDLYVSIATKTATLMCSITMFYSILVSFPAINSKINTDFKSEITYTETNLSGNELDYVFADDVVSMINNSSRLTQEEKDFLCNYDLISSIVPYYESTNMEYVIKTRLENFGIIYEKFSDDSNGKYYGSNEIVLNEDLKNADYKNSKGPTIAHEFIHVFQSDSLIYLKEASAEVISCEYYNYNVSAYTKACSNFYLLIETLGPRVMWNYIFSGNELEFKSLLKNNLETSDYNKLIRELNKSPFNDNPDHNLITNIIHKLYKNIYNENIMDNRDIYDFYGKYIEKKCFVETNEDYCDIIYCDKDKAINDGLAKYTTVYNYKTEISVQKLIDFINENNSMSVFKDNTYNYGVLIKTKDNNDKIYCAFDNGKIVINVNNKEERYDLSKDSIDILSSKYKFFYYIKTDDKNNELIKGMELINDEVVIMSNSNDYKAIFDQLEYKVHNICNRFPNQIIKKEYNKKIIA